MLLSDMLMPYVVEKNKDPTKLIRWLILYHYPGRDDIVDCVLKIWRAQKKKERQQPALLRSKLLKTLPVQKDLLMYIASFLELPGQVKRFTALSRAHRDAAISIIQEYNKKMEARRMAVEQRYEVASEYYDNGQVGDGHGEEGYNDMFDWIIDNIVDTPYFTFEECLEYISDYLNDDIDTRLTDMIAFLDAANEHYVLDHADYLRVINLFR